MIICVHSVKSANAKDIHAAKCAKSAVRCTIKSVGGPARLAKVPNAKSATAMVTPRLADSIPESRRVACPWTLVANIAVAVSVSTAKLVFKKKKCSNKKQELK